MAENNEKLPEVAKESKPEKKAEKKPNFFVRAFNRVKKFFKDFKGEWKKVTWPTGKTVFNHSIVVIVIVAIVGLVIFGIDTGLSAIIDALVKLANEREAQQAAVTVQQMISLFMMK